MRMEDGIMNDKNFHFHRLRGLPPIVLGTMDVPELLKVLTKGYIGVLAI